jgi:hypothetical protein
MDAKIKKILFVEIGVMFWSTWLSRNDIVFNKKNQSYLIYMLCSEQLIGQEHGRHSKRRMIKRISELFAI